jgi:hypothetical protein
VQRRVRRAALARPPHCGEQLRFGRAFQHLAAAAYRPSTELEDRVLGRQTILALLDSLPLAGIQHGFESRFVHQSHTCYPQEPIQLRTNEGLVLAEHFASLPLP